MQIIVCNIGSSSFKFQLLDMPGEAQRARGYTERVGTNDAIVTYWVGDRQVFNEVMPVPSHREAVQHALAFLQNPAHGLLASLEQIDGVGFKAVQAGEKNGSVLLADDVLEAMEAYRDLAPAHNPPYLIAIRMFRELLPRTPLVGVFEPGFHTTIPEYARVYGAPYDWYADHGVRKYGYHGASHKFIATETVRQLSLDPANHRIISCHLGGSSSLCAIRNGASLDTSMGFSPQSGLLQGTRVGDMDPFALPYIMKKKGITLEKALEECSKKGGLAGLSGISADMREINAAIARGDARALLARQRFIYDIKRYVGEFLVLLGGLDALVFTGGIGQKDAALRSEVMASLAFLGVKVDEAKNAAHATVVTTPDSAVAGLVLVTDEEIVVARETVRVIGS
ncbi:MAG: acetate/propionate family kinase [Ignavibacteriae bacterium]|mgnify:CR=1 FL=1|nr:acetate/propionate family kinase [Ignavibacteriota bacterium]